MKLSTRAELRAAAPHLGNEIDGLIAHRCVRPSVWRGGIEYFDEDVVLVAADVRATEAKVQRSSRGIRSNAMHRTVQLRAVGVEV